VVTDQGIDPATRRVGFGLQPVDQVNNRDAIRATVEVVAQESQAGPAPTPNPVLVEQVHVPKRSDQLSNVPVHVADYIVHLPNLGTVRVIQCQT